MNLNQLNEKIGQYFTRANDTCFRAKPFQEDLTFRLADSINPSLPEREDISNLAICVIGGLRLLWLNERLIYRLIDVGFEKLSAHYSDDEHFERELRRRTEKDLDGFCFIEQMRFFKKRKIRKVTDEFFQNENELKSLSSYIVHNLDPIFICIEKDYAGYGINLRKTWETTHDRNKILRATPIKWGINRIRPYKNSENYDHEGHWFIEGIYSGDYRGAILKVMHSGDKLDDEAHSISMKSAENARSKTNGRIIDFTKDNTAYER